MNVSHTAQHVRKRIYIDGIPKRVTSAGSRIKSCPSRDFAAQPLTSTVFFRGSRVDYQNRLGAGEFPNRTQYLIDDIRLNKRESSTGFDRARSRFRYIWQWRTIEKSLIEVGAVFALSPRFALRTSLVGAVFLGVVLTVLTYRYFGEYALAGEGSSGSSRVVFERNISLPDEPTVLGASDHADERFVAEVTDDLESIREVEEKEALEAKIREMVAGYPIEEMVPYIVEKDKIVAAFLVGIAKKESAWGKRVPLLKSHDCFNYWGYRGKRRFMGTGGHTCFNSPKDAVDTVSRRLEKLIYAEKIDTPAEMMVVWKCGYDCSTHDKAATKKWIQDVDLYFHEIDE